MRFARCSWLRGLLPPGVAEGELDAGVDAGVSVAERSAGDVNGVCAEVDGPVRTEKVVNSDATLRGEVEDAGVGVYTIVLRVVGRSAECGVFVVRPERAPGGLEPEGKSFGADYVPTKDYRRDGYSGEGAPHGVKGCAYGRGAGRICAEGPLKLWRVGLPEWKDFDSVFEVAAERAAAVVARQDFAGVNARQKKLKVVAVFSNAEATLNESAYFEVLKT